MATVDTVVKNAYIVSPHKTQFGGIAIQGGKVVAVGSNEALPPARETIDAEGKHVMPGVVDIHIHLQDFQNPFHINIQTETKSSAIGGVTTIVPTLLNRKDPTLSFREYFPYAKQAVETYSTIDVAFNAVLGTDEQVADIPHYAEELGITGFKFYMAYTGDEAAVFGIQAVDDGLLLEGFRQCARLGYPLRAMFHAENMEIIHRLKAQLMADGRTDLKAWTDARPSFAEEECLRRALFFAEVAKAPIYVVHLSVGEGVQMMRDAIARGMNLVAETCPHYLTFTKHDHDKIGTLGKVNPPLRDTWDAEQLWQGLRDGTISCFGGDHSTVYPRAIKAGTDIWSAIPGFPLSGITLPVMLSEAVNKGRLSFERLVEIVCYNNAKTFGLYPKKGSLEVGSDADLVVVDLNKEQVVTAEVVQSASDWCLYEGWNLKGWPVLTMVRGKVVARDGKAVGEEGYGRYLRRRVGRGLGAED